MAYYSYKKAWGAAKNAFKAGIFAKRVYKKAFPKKRRAVRSSGLASVVRRIIRKDEQAHHLQLSAAQILTDTTLYTAGTLTEIAQGANDADRIGDRVAVEAFKVRGRIDGSATANTVHVRLMLVKHSHEVGVGQAGAFNVAGTNGLDFPDIFYNVPGDPVTNAIVDPKRVNVIYDKIFTLTPQISGQVVTRNFKMTIPIKRKFSYKSNDAYGKFGNYYWVVTSYQLGATAGTTAVATLTMTNDIIFKNLD